MTGLVKKFRNPNAANWAIVSDFQSSGERVPSKIPIFQTGLYEPGYGRAMDVSEDHLRKMVENFEKKVIAAKISVYYGHWEQTRKAAGEVESLLLEYDEEMGKTRLYAVVNWTKAGEAAVQDREYKYISAEVASDFSRLVTEEGERKYYGATLMGVALVNEPGVWDLPPIVFSLAGAKKTIDSNYNALEYINKNKPVGEDMEKLFKLLGVKTEQEAISKFESLSESLSDLKAKETDKKFAAKIEERDSRIAELEKTIKDNETKAFEKERDEFVDALFKAEKITAEKQKAVKGYNKIKFEAFKEVYEDLAGDSGSKLPEVHGHGKEPAGDEGKGSFDAFVKKFAGGEKELSMAKFQQGVI